MTQRISCSKLKKITREPPMRCWQMWLLQQLSLTKFKQESILQGSHRCFTLNFPSFFEGKEIDFKQSLKAPIYNGLYQAKSLDKYTFIRLLKVYRWSLHTYYVSVFFRLLRVFDHEAYSLTRLTWLIHTSVLPSKWNLYQKIPFLA